MTYETYFDLDFLSSGISKLDMPFSAEKPNNGEEHKLETSDSLLLVRGEHFCQNNNRIDRLKQLLIGKPEKLIGL